MAEVVTFNAPVAQDAGATTFRIALLVLDWEHALLKVHLAEWTNGDFVPGGKVRTLRKDLAMAVGVAAEYGLELPHLESAFAILDGLVERGDGDLDCAAIYTLRAPVRGPSAGTP